MRLATKHANQQTVTLYDFTGGLNTSTTEETIADNQLAVAVNVEVDSVTGLLRTVSGTRTLFKVEDDGDHNVSAAAYDVLNDTLLLFLDCGLVLATQDRQSYEVIGRLTGSKNVVTTVWEDGLLVASGGRLQYVAGTQMKTISASPPICNGVFVRNGRVFVFDDEDNLRYSAVGDETNWTEDSNDPSAAIFVQIGYKAGGKIIGLVNMSSDMLIIKSNGMVFRLIGDYPDWSISEVGRNIFCKGPAAFCSAASNVMIMGASELAAVVTTQDYGDMRPQNIGANVEREIKALPAGVKARYVPPLQQVWYIGDGGYVLVYDLTVGAFFERRFNGTVADIVAVNDVVYVAKINGLSVLDEMAFTDDGEPLEFQIQSKTMIADYDYLIKRVVINVTPQGNEYVDDNYFHVGAMRFAAPLQVAGKYVYHNYTKIYRSSMPLVKSKAQIVYSNSEFVFDNFEDIYGSDRTLYPSRMYASDNRIRYRNKAVRIRGTGSGVRFILNSIKLDVVEV